MPLPPSPIAKLEEALASSAAIQRILREGKIVGLKADWCSTNPIALLFVSDDENGKKCFTLIKKLVGAELQGVEFVEMNPPNMGAKK